VGLWLDKCVNCEKLMGRKGKSFVGRYWPAGVILAAGLAASGLLGILIYRGAVRLDEARFELETTVSAALLEKHMERYEERLARLADYCAQFEELPTEIWYFRRNEMTDLSGNLPCVTHAAYCPKIISANFEAHLARGRTLWSQLYRFDPPPAPGRDCALPVWQFWSHPEFKAIKRGMNMAEESDWHPSVVRALERADAWISEGVAQVTRKDGVEETGFWLVLSLFCPDQEAAPWSLPNESPEASILRRQAFRRSVATGILAAFISVDRMLDQYNRPPNTRRTHLRLYAHREPSLASLLNPSSKPPEKPEYRRVVPMRWYRNAWALEATSTPLFESESLQYRGWVAGGAGGGLSLLASALVAVAMRARGRQEQMTEQIREARDALAEAQRERERLGHDLHDSAIQSLYGIQLRLGHTANHFNAEPALARREFGEVRAELDTVIAEIRSFLVAGTAGKETVDLAGVLLAIAERAKAGSETRIEVECDPMASSRLSSARAVQLANITREALSNSLRHGQPDRVEIALRSDNGVVLLEISDDGAGFDTKAKSPQGVGLTSMAKRAQEIRGEFDVQSTPGRGTKVVVRVPVGES